MSDRPDPGREAPDGCEFVAVPDDGWTIGGREDRACRWSMSSRCPNPTVASFQRGNGPWFYCADHMFGRWIEDGAVMVWVVREIESAGA